MRLWKNTTTGKYTKAYTRPLTGGHWEESRDHEDSSLSTFVALNMIESIIDSSSSSSSFDGGGGSFGGGGDSGSW